MKDEMNDRFMKRAIELASRGNRRTRPNPMVGAVVVLDGTIVGEGYHRQAGDNHAEVDALSAAGEKSRNADLYVNLEPCDHYGRTPPCTEAIIRSGIRRVFVGCADPNPLVNGKGMARLREADIEVVAGVKENTARKLNEFYFKHITTGVPFVIAKMALSLDGKIAARSGDTHWISNEKSRARVHALRGMVDAVMVGVGTVLADDPLLNVRIAGWDGFQPKRVVVDSRLRTPLESRLLQGASEIETIIATTRNIPNLKAQEIKKTGAHIITVEGPGPGVDMGQLLRKLGSMDVTSVLLEGGSELFTTAFEGKHVDKVMAFIAPCIIGGTEAISPVMGIGARTVDEAIRLDDVNIELFDDNVMIEGYVHNAGHGPMVSKCLPD